MFKWYNTEEETEKRIEELEITLLQTIECQCVYKKMDKLFNEVNQYLPEERKHLIMDISDCFTESLILYENFFYRAGHTDNKKIFERLFSQLMNIIREKK